jgi:hypothetical protein
VRILLERVSKPAAAEAPVAGTNDTEQEPAGKLTTSRFARKLGLKTSELLDRAVAFEYIEAQGEQHVLASKGQQSGVEFIAKSRFGHYFLWPERLEMS